MTSKSIKYNALKFIFQCGQIREGSLNLYLFSKHNSGESDSKRNAYRTIQQLMDDGFIEKVTWHIKKTNNHPKDFEEVYQITSKGINLILDSEEDPYYEKIAPNCLKKFAVRKSDNILSDGIPFQSERVEAALNYTDIFAMMAACDVPVFQHDKPSLLYLSDSIVGSHTVPKSGYQDKLTKVECAAKLEKGIYYSSAECLEYLNKVSRGIGDTISGSRFKGIFISDKSCFVIYTSKKYNNKILRANIKGESGLLNVLDNLSDFTHIYRRIPDFDEFNTPSGSDASRFKNGPSALFISDGDVLAYSIATGNPSGKAGTTNTEKATLTTERRVKEMASTDPEKNRATTYLTAASQLYDRMYIVPTTTKGVFSLQYLLSHTLEEWKEDGCSIMEEDKMFKKSKDNFHTFPYKMVIDNKTVPVTYMPVIEAKALYRIATTDQNPVILTFKDLLNIVSRSMRKEGHYYDADEMEMFDKDAAYIYDRVGNIKGEAMLDEFLKSNGMTFNKKTERTNIPERCGYDNTIKFYNAIARGELDLEDIAEKVKTVEYVEKPRYYKKTFIVSCSMSRDLGKKLKDEADKNHTTVSKVVSDALTQYFKSK